MRPAGLMIVKDEPYLIEYNVRMGDPECQTILPKLKTDLVDIFLACCNETLDKIDLNWSDKKSLCVVMCSKGYPDEFKKNIEIKNFDNLELSDDEYVFHAGTLEKNKKLYAVGGRVLNFVVISDNFINSKNRILLNLEKLNWQGGFYRKDIGYKVID
jgi:phosphoribosylamine--glycine ligase